MPEAGVVLVVAALAVLGFVSGRSWMLLAPFFAVPAFYLGLDREWWGNGLGDGWQYAMFAVLTVAVVATAAGVTVRRALSLERGLHRRRG
jgi:hypothetical protein